MKMAVIIHIILLVFMGSALAKSPQKSSQHNVPRKQQLAMNARAAKTTPKPVPCFKESFAGAGECCKESPFDLFSRKAHLKCHSTSSSPKALDGSRQYILNLWQQMTSNNALEIYKDHSPEIRDKKRAIACHLECLYKNHSLMMPNNALNFDAIAEYFKTNTEPISRAIVMDAVRNCTKIAPRVTAVIQNANPNRVYITPNERFCSPNVFVFTQCIVKEILLNCNMPLLIDDGDGNFGEMCKRHRKMLELCDIMPVLPEMDHPTTAEVNKVDLSSDVFKSSTKSIETVVPLKTESSLQGLTVPTIPPVPAG